MATRLIAVLLFVLSSGLMFSDGRILEVHVIPVMHTTYMLRENEMRISAENAQNEKICTLCEQFTAQAMEYLGQNKTQQEINDSLRVACSRLPSIEKQCILLVDYYAPIFFLEVATINPQVFCEKVSLCERMNLLYLLGQDQACTICQNTVIQMLSKLKDPETQLEIIQVLLKACGQFENFTQQCKRIVFEYGPVILLNVEKYFETTDICTALHVCKANEVQTLGQAFLTELHLLEA